MLNETVTAANDVAVLINAADSADVHYFNSCEEAATYALENSATDWELTINSGEIPGSCFRDINLVKLTLNEGVTSIGSYAFYNCSGLMGELVIPEGVTSIGDYAFNGCSVLTGSLAIPGSVTSIGNYAFRYCSGFTGSLAIPGGVTSIGNYAFYGCSGFDDDLSYGGTGDPGGSSSNVFNSTAFSVCKVTASYEDSVFCGLPVEMVLSD